MVAAPHLRLVENEEQNVPSVVRVRAADILALGDEQMRNPGNEIGGALVGEQNGTAFNVDRIVSLGVGAEPGATTFTVGEEESERARRIPRRPRERLLGLGHTHGPRTHLRGPSTDDIDQAQSNYRGRVCLVLKVDADGGGRLEFFTGRRRNLPFEIVGMDGRIYRSTGTNSASFARSCWQRPHAGRYESEERAAA